MIKKVTLLTTLGAITLGIAIGVSANGIVQKVQSEIRGDFVIKTNGQIQTLKSVDGETVYPMLYEGTTYLPVRAIAELNNKDCVWYEDTKTIDIVDKTNSTVTDADKIVNGDISKQTPVPRQTSQPSQGGYDITNSTKITLDKAIEIVVNKAGVSENDLYSKNANYDYDHGQYIVEVEIDTKSTEYDAKIDAVSGNVLEWNSKNERVNSYINLNGVISLDKAIEIVVAEKNIDTNKILAKKASYDYERGKTVIGVEIYVDGFEYDVELDAMTGTVQKWN